MPTRSCGHFYLYHISQNVLVPFRDKLLGARLWAIQVNEPTCNEQVEDGWLTLAKPSRHSHDNELFLWALQHPSWQAPGCGAVLYAEEDALRLAQVVLASEKILELNRPVRILQVFTGLAQSVGA